MLWNHCDLANEEGLIMTSPKALGEKNGQIMKVVTIEIETGNEGQRWLTYFCVISLISFLQSYVIKSPPYTVW